MHEQARLTVSNQSLGSAGTVINISVVASHYSTSAQANSAATFKCIDQQCGVSVAAVITQKSKLGRKTSQRPYFRATPTHAANCARAAIAVQSLAFAIPASARTAAPNRNDFPSVWDDPVSRPTKSANLNQTHVPQSSQAAGISTKTKSTGAPGINAGHSKLLESFVLAWIKMTATDSKNAALKAPWNTGGTYYSAFKELSHSNLPAPVSCGTKIFVGTIAHIQRATTGWIFRLNEKFKSKLILEFFIPETVVGASPELLASLIGAEANMRLKKPVIVYALGFFAAKAGTLNLRVEHHQKFYLK